MYEILKVSADTMLQEAQRLFQGHWEEIALNKAVMILNPDGDRYRAMEAAGILHCLAAYYDGEMVGYSVVFLMHHPHYAGLKVAQNDILYVRPDHRQSRLGLRLIRETEQLAREHGAALAVFHAKEGTALEALMPRLGYRVQDVIFSKEL